jgi:hypothetical protein
MKNLKIYFTFILFVAFVGTADAQSRKERRMERKQERLERKQQKAEAEQQQKEKILALAEDQSFVLEADALFDRYMNRYNMVNNSFIMLNGSQVVLQTANLGGNPGYNGMGGITLNGRLTDYEILEGRENGPLRISAQVSTNAVGHGTLMMTISHNGHATGVFRDNWGNRVTFTGQISDLENSRVYKGMSLFG